jgi:UDP-N-acetyl-D-mannosaminuronic acid dehydrogenase
VSVRSNAPSLLGGSIALTPNPCRHDPARHVHPWLGEVDTAGTVTVIGAGKMGLPLAAQFASHGWSVIAVDIDADVVDAINAGRSHIGDEPGLADLVAEAHADGRLRATLDAAAATAASDVVVLIVPVMLDADGRPDRRSMDRAVDALAPGLHAGVTVVFETTLPVGTTRRYATSLAARSGLTLEQDLFVAFSPERLYSGAALGNLATYPKLIGGLGPASTDRGATFYGGVLDAEVVTLSSAEAAEMAKLADTTYRDVNIALANEFARVADDHGIDILEVIDAANSQPYSHIHRPGLGVGGHCIPVYPRFLLDEHPELELISLARDINDGQVDRVLDMIAAECGPLEVQTVLVLGLTYREGVHELAYSRAIPLITGLLERGARTLAYDPLLTSGEIERTGATVWRWGSTDPDVSVVITQTADMAWNELDGDWFPGLQMLVDGRNSLRAITLPETVTYVGIGGRR